MDTAAKQVEVNREDGIAVVSMNRPEKRNALSLELMRALTAAFREIGSDRSIPAVILRGEGPAFSAGHDLRELRCTHSTSSGQAQNIEVVREIFDTCVELMETIQKIPQPVIAEVATIATAAGCQLVATCDLAMASTEARFATPGVRIGLFCTTPMVALTRAIGRKRAMEMLLTGDFIDAATAAEWGLVNRVVPPDSLHAETLKLAGRIAEASRLVVGIGKNAYYAQIEMDQQHAYAYAKDVMSMNALAQDAQEGMEAFIERREPSWRQ